MGTPAWPEWMPRPLQSGFSMQPEDRRIASSTVGTSFQRGFGGDVCVADVTLTLNRVEAPWLEQFERNTARQGSVWFDFPLWYGGQVHWEKCRFKTRPKLTAVDGLYSRFSFSLYVRRRTGLMPECIVAVFACFPPCWFFDFNGEMQTLLSTLAHVTTAGVSAALAGIHGE